MSMNIRDKIDPEKGYQRKLAHIKLQEMQVKE